MAPRTRKPRSRISYVEEPDSPEDEFEQVFNIKQLHNPSNSDEESDYNKSRQHKRRRRSKHRRIDHRIALASILLPPDLSDQDSDHDELPSDLFKTQRLKVTQPPVTPATITLHLPLDLQVTTLSIDLDDIGNLGMGMRPHLRINSDGSFTAAKKRAVHWCLIDSLPAEIRVRVLRLLLVRKDPIEFTNRLGLKRSAQVLQLSRTFHDDGTKILYGENCFHFQRAAVCRGKYWEPQWKEVGFKDVRRFLHDIGENKKKLRYVSFQCLDAAPTDTPTFSAAQRRFVNDPVLLACFNMIADNAVLERFAIGMHGRAMVTESDGAFLRALTRIKCHELTFTTLFSDYKIGDDLMDKIRSLMDVGVGDLTEARKVRVQMPFEHKQRMPLAASW